MPRRRKKSTTPAATVSGDPPVTISGDDPAATAALGDFMGTTKDHARANVEAKRRKRTTVPAETNVDAWGQVIETVFDLDPVTLLERLTVELRLGLLISDYGRLRSAVDAAASNLYDAKRLERGAKHEEQKYLDDTAVEMDLMRTEARKQLQKKREPGSGAITKQQIEDEMTATWPDLVSRHRRRKSGLHNAARAFEGLVDAWNHRNSQLKAMLERASLGRPRSGGQ